MAKQTINIGTSDNDGTGDSIRHAFSLANANFTELYDLVAGGSSVYFTSLADTPKTLIASSSTTPVLLISSDIGSTVTQSTLVAGYGIEIKTTNTLTNTSTITLSISTATSLFTFSLITDHTPTLYDHLNGSGNKGVNFADPQLPQDLVTLNYLDNVFVYTSPVVRANTLWNNDSGTYQTGHHTLTTSSIVARDSLGDIYATTMHGVATSAKYADLAENYIADDVYDPGTVVVFGGDKEITLSAITMDKRIAGVVSTKPAYLMNSELENGTPVALQGRVPCKVVGSIHKGDLLIQSPFPGVAMAHACPVVGSMIGKALEEYASPEVGVIEIVVGKA